MITCGVYIALKIVDLVITQLYFFPVVSALVSYIEVT